MDNVIDAMTYSVEDDDGVFDVTVLQPESAVRSVLFAAGLGGNPTRHSGLLQTLAADRTLVVAPHFEMLASSAPTRAELMQRGRRLASAANRFCAAGTPISGVGHSIGTVLLLMLAGAVASTLTGDRLELTAEHPLNRLALFAPPTDFFKWPGALASVRIPIQVWVGGRDAITPPIQASFLKKALKDQADVDIVIVEDAGHFTFMNDVPPKVTDPHPDRGAFLQSLGEEVSRFLAT